MMIVTMMIVKCTTGSYHSINNEYSCYYCISHSYGWLIDKMYCTMDRLILIVIQQTSLNCFNRSVHVYHSNFPCKYVTSLYYDICTFPLHVFLSFPLILQVIVLWYYFYCTFLLPSSFPPFPPSPYIFPPPLFLNSSVTWQFYPSLSLSLSLPLSLLSSLPPSLSLFFSPSF